MTQKPVKLAKATRQTKTEKILALLHRNNGATIAELAKATGWQKQSVHGLISGTLKKKQGLQIKSTKEENKDRCYWIEGSGK